MLTYSLTNCQNAKKYQNLFQDIFISFLPLVFLYNFDRFLPRQSIVRDLEGEECFSPLPLPHSLSLAGRSPGPSQRVQVEGVSSRDQETVQPSRPINLYITGEYDQPNWDREKFLLLWYWYYWELCVSDAKLALWMSNRTYLDLKNTFRALIW